MATKIINKTPASVELRFLTELRAASDADFCLEGYAALFNSESNDLGGFREVVAPAAFDNALGSGRDVKCLFNHDANHVLGRTKSGTLKLSTDNRGLRFRCQLDQDNAAHRNLYATVKRGDVDECSFAFTVDDEGQEWKQVGDGDSAYILRTLKKVDLYDVSAVTYPAYPGTSVGAREASLTPEVRSSLEAFKRSLADLAQQHKHIADAHSDAAAAHGSQAADHAKAAELLEQESARMEECSKSMGNCAVEACDCQNQIIDKRDAYVPDYGDDELDALLDEDDRSALDEDGDADGDEKEKEEEDASAYRTADGKTEKRAAGDGGKVRTKKVDGKNLTKKYFAYVGDPDRTETWKLPIHDADHVRNALARFSQTDGIPEDKKAAVLRKIKAAAKRFGITVSADDSRSWEPMSPKEIADALFKARALCS